MSEPVTKLKLLMRIEDAILIREKGCASQSIEILTNVMLECDGVDFIPIWARALGERICSHKHLFQLTGKKEHLANMESDVLRGLGSKYTDKKAFWLRRGDIETSKKNYINAEQAYQIAYDSIRDESLEKCEYLGHWAESLIDIGNPGSSLHKLDLAIFNGSHYKENYNQWLIVMSGLYGRKFRAARACKKNWPLITSGLKGYTMAWILFIFYGQPMRLKQFHLRLLGKGI